MALCHLLVYSPVIRLPETPSWSKAFLPSLIFFSFSIREPIILQGFTGHSGTIWHSAPRALGSAQENWCSQLDNCVCFQTKPISLRSFYVSVFWSYFLISIISFNFSHFISFWILCICRKIIMSFTVVQLFAFVLHILVNLTMLSVSVVRKTEICVNSVC